MSRFKTFSQPLACAEAQFGDRPIGAAVRGRLSSSWFRGLEARAIGLQETLFEFAAQQGGPGFEVHLQAGLARAGALRPPAWAPKQQPPRAADREGPAVVGSCRPPLEWSGAFSVPAPVTKGLLPAVWSL